MQDRQEGNDNDATDRASREILAVSTKVMAIESGRLMIGLGGGFTLKSQLDLCIKLPDGKQYAIPDAIKLLAAAERLLADTKKSLAVGDDEFWLASEIVKYLEDV